MNHLKNVSSRGSWCRFKSSQSLTPIKIPSRIERGPTDILTALESTVPEEGIRCRYMYHDDPYLFPRKKQNYRYYALSYESGRRTAMLIHKTHRVLFPKHLSEPPIKAFEQPCSLNKPHLSEEVLLQAISDHNLSDAITIYKSLESDVSNTAKQALLESLCFYSNNKIESKELPIEKWYSKREKPFWQQTEMITELYQFLIKQGPETAVLAHNALLSGLAKHGRKDETTLLFETCKQENIPLTVTTYNYVITTCGDSSAKKYENVMDLINNVLKTMNEQRVKPNVRTLNAILRITTKFPVNVAESYMKYICQEFKKLNIKYSLATYHYIARILALQGPQTHNSFKKILHKVWKSRFVMQDPSDVKFFTHAMFTAAYIYCDQKTGDLVHEILKTGDNSKFLADNAAENTYYSAYMSLMLSTCTLSEFFNFYDKFVPNLYIPTIQLYIKIVEELSFQERSAIIDYIAKLWLDIVEFGYEDLSLRLYLLQLMDISSLPVDLPARSIFVDAALSCWNIIKLNIERSQEKCQPFETAITGSIALTLLRDDRINESIEILTQSIEQTHLFTPTMKKPLLNELFETCILKQCFVGALLVLEYGVNFGFTDVIEMAKKLYNVPQLTDAERNRLISLVGEKELNTSDVSTSK